MGNVSSWPPAGPDREPGLAGWPFLGGRHDGTAKLPDGMVEREGRDGYYCDFQVGGRRIRKFLATDFKAAVQILNQLKAQADKAEFGLLDNTCTLAKLRESYLTHCKQTLRPRTVDAYEEWLGDIIKELGLIKVSQVTKPAILVYRETRLAQGKHPRTVNAKVSQLSAMLTYGVEFGFLGTNPMAGLAPLPHDNPKEGRALEPVEVKKLLDACTPRMRNIWYALLVTGMRLNELAADAIY